VASVVAHVVIEAADIEEEIVIRKEVFRANGRAKALPKTLLLPSRIGSQEGDFGVLLS
jgi:hypothetical protein